MGFNVDYKFKLEDDLKIIKWFKDQKTDFGDLTLKQISISKKEETHDLNVMMISDGENIAINYNFHYQKIVDIKPNHYLELINKSKEYLIK